MPVRLPDAAAQAVADLVPLLGGGEEAAATAFARLADGQEFSDAITARLRRIGAEEHVHLALLCDLAATLPLPHVDYAQRRASRLFHVRLARGGAVVHLARIAAIDAAVCTILSRLLARGTPVACDPVLASLFARIRRDESRHVAIARAAVSASPDRTLLRDEAVGARQSLAALIEPVGGVFEILQVDPETLLRDIRRMPDRLL